MSSEILSEKAEEQEAVNHCMEDIKILYESERRKTAELESANRQMVMFANDLNKTLVDLKKANTELKAAYLDTIRRLVIASEYKDDDTGTHILRISHYSVLLAEKLGFTSEERETLFYASPMHDVGKIGIPDRILLKPGRLTADEFDLMKTHTTIGAKILSGSKAPLLKMAEEIAQSHHEKFNGKGYPAGLTGSDIPLTGRIVGLVDVFDALTSRRPYKEPYPPDLALDIMKKDRGTHFDPQILDIFVENIDDILRIRKEIGSEESVQSAKTVLSERDRGEQG